MEIYYTAARVSKNTSEERHLFIMDNPLDIPGNKLSV